MKCHICGNELEEITISRKTGKIEPCHSCLSKVQEVLEDYETEDEDILDDEESGLFRVLEKH